MKLLAQWMLRIVFWLPILTRYVLKRRFLAGKSQKLFTAVVIGAWIVVAVATNVFRTIEIPALYTVAYTVVPYLSFGVVIWYEIVHEKHLAE